MVYLGVAPVPAWWIGRLLGFHGVMGSDWLDGAIDCRSLNSVVYSGTGPVLALIKSIRR
jgi:hypothetical protein